MMNPLKHIVHSLPRHATPTNAISVVSSGYQINAPNIFRHGSDFLRGNRPEPSQSFTGYGQKIAMTSYRNASTNRVGHPNAPVDSRKSDDSNKIDNKNEKRAQQLPAVPEPRNYAKLIADYSEAMEKRSMKPKSKEMPIGLLSRLPIESLISSLSPFEKTRKNFKSKIKKRDSIGKVAKLNAKQSNRAVTHNSENKKNSATMKGASQKRDYFTKNYESESKVNDTSSQSTSSLQMKNSYMPNDFDIICDLTNQQKNSQLGVRSDFDEMADHKVKEPSNLVDGFELSKPTLDNNHCQFNIVASEEKIELKLTSELEKIPMTQQSIYKYNQKNNPLPWWTTPDSILNEKYEKADRASKYSTPEVQVIYSEEMTNVEIAKRQEKAPSEFNQQEKLANLSKTKQYIKEELEKHKKNKERRKRIVKQTNIDGKQVDEDKSRSINERSEDKTATLSKMIDREIEETNSIAVLQAVNKKSSSENNTSGIPEARKRSIDQEEYRMKRVTEPLKPLEKKKDGTLIDYGLKVPTRRPKKKPATSERNPEKKNSAPQLQEITSDSQLGKSAENERKNNSSGSSSSSSDLVLRRNNYSGEAISERLVNSLKQQSRSEQMFRRRREDSCGCHSDNCRLNICAVVDSTINTSDERPEKQLIYSVWLNRFHTLPTRRDLLL